MAAKTKTYRKECAYCKTEYTAKSPLSKTCSDTCRKALSRARKSEGVTPSHTVTVTPENGQPRGSQSTLDQKIETLIELQIKNEQRQARLMDFLEQVGLGVFSTGQPSAQTATSFGTKVPYQTPLVLDDGYEPVPASERGIGDDDTMPKIEVKQSTKKVDTGQNFLNSILALG